MVSVLVVDGDVQDRVDVPYGQIKSPVPDGRDRLLLRVRLESVVVELKDNVGVALPPEVGCQEALGAKHANREVTDVVEVARKTVEPLKKKENNLFTFKIGKFHFDGVTR
jgi:hypothetical protein